jgi:16S rRNA (cytosine1402-N4)-methyltransferase
MYAEVMEALCPQPGRKYVDLTLGAGGHSEGILRLSAPDGALLAFELDAQAVQSTSARLAAENHRLTVVNKSYLNLAIELKDRDWGRVDGVIADFGVSSMQFDDPQRGFAFMQDGPLDMRFDKSSGATAAGIVNTWEEDDLVDIFQRYGEERQARRIARAILKTRPFETTVHLADVIEAAVARGPQRIHPATRVFQALRIVVNKELDAVAAVLPLAVAALKSGARFAAISFHSLEDRIIKNYFKQVSTSFNPQPDQPGLAPRLARVRLVNKKPITASPEELMDNPRARSAKLRVVEKI